jgi:hypothetical protein
VIESPIPIPEPVVDADDAPVPEGEAVVAPLLQGPAVRLRFPSPYEPFLTLEGRRIVEDQGPATRDLLFWFSRRMPALWRALDTKRALLGVLHGGAVVVHDVVDLADATFLDHGLARQTLEPARVALPQVALLGTVTSRSDIAARSRGMYAAGTTVEVRVEDGGRVVARRLLRIGR